MKDGIPREIAVWPSEKEEIQNCRYICPKLYISFPSITDLGNSSLQSHIDVNHVFRIFMIVCNCE